VLNYMIVVMFLAQAGNVDLTLGQVALGMGLAILLNMGTITVPGGFPVVAMFLATSLGLPFEAVGLLIAVNWFTGIFRTSSTSTETRSSRCWSPTPTVRSIEMSTTDARRRSPTASTPPSTTKCSPAPNWLTDPSVRAALAVQPGRRLHRPHLQIRAST
jgi:hypothetical protein